MNETDGMNVLVFEGPFGGLSLGNERETMLQARNIVLKSKNGTIGNTPVVQLKTIKQIVLDLLQGMAKSQSTKSGLQTCLEGGDILLYKDLFWIKSSSKIS